MKLLLALTAALALIAAPTLTRPAEACSCLPPDIANAYANDTDLLTVTIIARYWGPTQTVYNAQVLRSYKGCKPTGQLIRLVTPTSSAACGVTLQPKRRYVIAGNALWPKVLAIHQCNFIKQWNTLTPGERDFLDGRMICCQGGCKCGDGTDPVACFADPCTVSSCPEGECTANYCGGCNAEYYTDSGHLVCNPCETDADCAWNQHCSLFGTCRSGCTSDLECETDQWCRPTQSGEGDCTPLAQQGEPCGGFVPPWAVEKCAPGLACADTTPNIADLPGVCSAPCKSNADCDLGDYCAGDGVCRTDGTCYAPADCSTQGNAWIHILCVGYPTCPFGKCDWKCGTPLQCKDVSGLDFGPCDMMLGWGMVNGECAPVSGCSALGYTFYGSPEECAKACNVLTSGGLP